MIIQEWLAVFQQLSNCYIPTLILIFLVSLAYMGFIWKISKPYPQMQLPLSAAIQITFCVIICILCGFSVIGFFAVPDNTENILSSLGFMGILDSVARYVQIVILTILKKLA